MLLSFTELGARHPLHHHEVSFKGQHAKESCLTLIKLSFSAICPDLFTLPGRHFEGGTRALGPSLAGRAF